MTSKLEMLKRPILVRLALVPALLSALPLQALAASTDIANSPFTVEGGSPAKPNVMFILDDSGSMARTHMPDSVEYDFLGKYGYVSAQCNGVYFDPTIKYYSPKKSDGSSYADMSFTAARYNGFDSASAVVNLATKFKAWDSDTATGDDTPQAAYYYKYTGKETVKDYRNLINYPSMGPKKWVDGVEFFEE